MVEKKTLNKIIKNIESSIFRTSVLKEISGYDFGVNFKTKIINRSPYELPIEGGKIIDLKTLEIRPRTIVDYWSFELNIDFLSECNFESNVLPFFRSIACNSTFN